MTMITRKELYNIPGWHTKRHLIVIESDDWGSIRMPSKDVYNNFLSKGIRVDQDPYCKFDNLATRDDLARLFAVLNSVKDKFGRPAVITANTVVSNPNFKKILDSNFTEYFYEPFTDTLKHCSLYDGAFDMWNEGMRSGVFHPQLHGREHLNVKKWLCVLRQGQSVTRIAFDLGTFGLTQHVDPSIKEYYMGAFNSGLDDDIEEYKGIITEAANMFEQIFGYRSKSFIATTYEWSPKIEPCLIENKIKYIQCAITQKIPIDDDTTVITQRRGFQGTKTKYGLIRLFRNCFFEPSTKPHFDFVDDCLNRVKLAFKWGKAANICAHRLNFIGSIHKENADKNLLEFKRLLKEIVKNWPDVEFVTSDRLGEIIEESGQYLLCL